MILEEIRDILRKKYRCDPLHDYFDEKDYIRWLGVYAEDIEELRKDLSDEWKIIERRRNPDNDFCRVDIIRRTK